MSNCETNPYTQSNAKTSVYVTDLYLIGQHVVRCLSSCIRFQGDLSQNNVTAEVHGLDTFVLEGS